jgi:DNA-binding NarL/FixJ family response regulator
VIAHDTVKSHGKHILDRLGAATRTHAVALALLGTPTDTTVGVFPEP